MRRILIVLTVLILIAIGYLLWRIAKQPEAVSTEPVIDSTPIGEEEGEEVFGPMVLSTQQAQDYWVDPAERKIYILSTEGSIYESFPGGIEKRILSLADEAVIDIAPSIDGAHILVTAGSLAQPTLYTIEVATGKRQFLPLGAAAAAWNPSQAKELVFYKTPDAPASAAIPAGSLNSFTVGTGKTKILTRLRLLDPVIEWNTASEILIGTRSSSQSTGFVWSYNIKANTLSTLVNDRQGLEIKGSADGAHLLVTTSNTETTSPLTLLTRSSGFQQQLQITTVPAKCTFDRTYLYCAAPSSESLKADAYYQRGAYTSDIIVALERKDPLLVKGKLLFTSDEKMTIDATNLQVVGEELYFINRYDNRLYAITL